jgi:CelD/BcsL family acetyltransferase involved in cellulose biosynthesis
MNFYASADYLKLVSEVYFHGRKTRIEDVLIGGEVLRLLVVDDRRVITSLPFLDYHTSLDKTEASNVQRRHSHANFVATRTLETGKTDFHAFEERELAPYIDWTKFSKYEDYKTFILGRQRGQVRENERRGRRLADIFKRVEFAMNDDGDDVLDFARKWKSRQLRQTGVLDYFACPVNLEYFSALKRKGLLVSSTLRGDKRLLSVWLGFIHERVWSGWIFTYDPDLRKYSVGHQLLGAIFQKSFELGHKEFDFSIGGEEYKLLYATDVRVLTSVGRLPFSERIFALARKKLKERHPKLFNTALTLRKEYRSWRQPL